LALQRRFQQLRHLRLVFHHQQPHDASRCVFIDEEILKKLTLNPSELTHGSSLILRNVPAPPQEEEAMSYKSLICDVDIKTGSARTVTDDDRGISAQARSMPEL